MTIVRKALEAVVRAWEATRSGTTTQREIQRWIEEDMKPAIDEARIALRSDEAEAVVGTAQAWTLIAAERRRQMDVEGWDEEHDDAHGDGGLLQAALAYLQHGTGSEPPARPEGTPVAWPWEPQWWKPKSRYEDVLRAGALSLAERERRIRAVESTREADRVLGLCIAALAELAPPESRAAA